MLNDFKVLLTKYTHENLITCYGAYYEEAKFCIDIQGWIVIHKSEKQFKDYDKLFDLDVKYDSEQELKFIRPKALSTM